MVVMGSQGLQSEDDVQGYKNPLPGRYLVAVVSAEEKVLNDKLKVIVEFRVLSGTVPGQEETTFTEFFATSQSALPRLQRFALAVGLLQPNEPDRELDFGQAVGRFLVVEVEENVYTKDGVEKKGVRVPWVSFWSVGNKEVEDVPKDPEAMKLAAAGGSAGNASAPGNADSHNAAGGGGGWDDF